MPKRRRACVEDPSHLQSNSFQTWANSFEKVTKWLDQYDLEQLLDDNDGIVQLTNFLPAKVAWGALNVLQQIPEVHLIHARCQELYPDIHSTMGFGNT